MKPPKKAAPAAAVIEFSSNNLRMVLGEKSGDTVKVLEFLEYPLSLGKETFTTGKVAFDKVNKACVIIKNYLEAAASYGVTPKDIRVIATSALREAGNKSYILDQVRLKTGLAVHILDSQEEKLHIFKMALRMLDRDLLESALLVFVGSGTVGISLIENGMIPYYQTIKIGPLRVSELFENIQPYSQEYHVVVEEYIKTFMDLKESLPDVEIKKLILTGGDVNVIKDLCGADKSGNVSVLKKASCEQLYSSIKNASSAAISKEMGIPIYRADLLIPAACICLNFFDFIGAAEAAMPQAYLNEAVLYGVLFPDEARKSDKAFFKNTVLCAQGISRRYRVNENHTRLVSGFAIKIFDKIRKLHGMKVWERTLLQCAAHLHDCGKFIDIKDHALHSYNIVIGLDIIGLNQADLRVLALICLLHSSAPPEEMWTYDELPEPEKTITAKLTAILRLADALDRSDLQKIKEIDVSFDLDELTVTVCSNRNIDLEKWSFESKSVFFEEVFGMKAILRVKAQV